MDKAILLVDDDLDIVNLTREAIGAIGYDVHIATSLGDAIRAIKHNAYDVLLVDLTLPDAKDVEAITTLTHLFPALPIVVITGSKDKLEESITAGAQEYLCKGDYTRDCLVEAIRCSIARHKVRQSFQPLTDAIARMDTTLKEARKA